MKQIIIRLGIILVIAACSTQKGLVKVITNNEEVFLKTSQNMNWKLLMQDLKPGFSDIIVCRCIAHSNTTKTGTVNMFLHGTIMP